MSKQRTKRPARGTQERARQTQASLDRLVPPGSVELPARMSAKTVDFAFVTVEPIHAAIKLAAERGGTWRAYVVSTMYGLQWTAIRNAKIEYGGPDRYPTLWVQEEGGLQAWFSPLGVEVRVAESKPVFAPAKLAAK